MVPRTIRPRSICTRSIGSVETATIRDARLRRFVQLPDLRPRARRTPVGGESTLAGLSGSVSLFLKVETGQSDSRPIHPSILLEEGCLVPPRCGMVRPSRATRHSSITGSGARCHRQSLAQISGVMTTSRGSARRGRQQDVSVRGDLFGVGPVIHHLRPAVLVHDLRVPELNHRPSSITAPATPPRSAPG